MYLDYFSLERHPFRITPDTSLFFSGGDQGRGVVLKAMLYAIENGEGILKVVGEVGSGKTMLCRMLEERLPESTEVVYLANPKLDPDEILYAVAFELKLPVRRDTSRLLVMQQLQNYLLKQHAANRKVLVTIEEAQSMPYETLEEIRLFSNLETHRDKLMQIILFGQPELDKNLSAKNIRQLRERITHSFYLNPLTPKEVADYIQFRLGAAGCPCPRLLTRGAERLIAKASGGLTRRINILADKALLAAYADNALKSVMELSSDMRGVIKRKHVAAAIADSDYPPSIMQNLFSALRLVSVSMVIVMVAVAILQWPPTSEIISRSKLAQTLRQTTTFSHAFDPIPASNPQWQPASLQEVAAPLLNANFETEHLDPPPVAKQAATTEASLITPTPAGEDSEAATPISRNLTRARILASIDWLQRADRNGYTVQFIYDDTANLDFAESFLAILDRNGLIDDSYVCISNDGSKSYWTVKYGNFSALTPAQQFVDELPAIMHEFKPFVQNMSVVECNSNFTIAALILE